MNAMRLSELRWRKGALLRFISTLLAGFALQGVARAIVFDPVAVDPAAAMVSPSFSVEWNSDGNMEGWTSTQLSSGTVSGGVFSAISASDPQIQLLNIASGIDLDLGFNDYLDLRIQVPADYTGDIRIYYGTANLGTVGQRSGTAGTPGITGTRFITIPAAKIPKDGAFHVYRYDLSLEINWRAYLHDLRIDPLVDASGNGKPFAIDYLRVGDLPNDTYLPNFNNGPTSSAFPSGDQIDMSPNELSSKHFRFIWGTTRATTPYQSGYPVVDATWAHGCLRNLEDIWPLYIKVYGYREPSQSVTPARVDGNKYKVNVLCLYDGYWQGGGTRGFGYLNVDPTGMRVNPPTWAYPHELMHVFQMHSQWPSGDKMPGEYHEGHANYGRELWIKYYNSMPGWTDLHSGIDAEFVNNQNMITFHARDYYLSWPWLLYLDENPDDLPDLRTTPTTAGMVAKLWQSSPSGSVSPYNTLETLTPNISVQDMIGLYARRLATFDFAGRTDIVAALNTQTPTVWNRMHITELTHSPDKPGWWRVPNEIAPMQGGVSIHQLNPVGSGAGRVVTVNFQGMPDAARGADWRACLVAVDGSGNSRYTSLWNNGNSSITLAANENTLYLTVGATPTNFPYVNVLPSNAELTNPYRTDPGKQRFPYEIQVSGATPNETQGSSTAGLIQVPNGGGWRASGAVVDATAYVGPNARVLNTAQVRGNARVEDYAVVMNGAKILGSAVVSGHALVMNNATVQDNAKIRDWAIVSNNSTRILGDSMMAQHARIWSAATTMSATSMAKGCAILQGNANLKGSAIMDGDTMGGRTILSGIAFGHLPYTGIPDNWIRPIPDGVTATYPFDLQRQSVAVDGYGSLEAYVRGAPTWVSADSKRTGFYLFNGSNQWLLLERLVADAKAFTFGAWVKPLGGAGNQALLWIGDNAGKHFYVTPDDGAGHAAFVISDGASTQTLLSNAPLALNVWSHIAVTLDGTTGILYVNGVSAASGPISIAPDSVLPPNTGSADPQCYIARAEGTALPMLHGTVDEVQFYRRTLSGAEIAALAPQGSTSGSAPVLGSISNQTVAAGSPAGPISFTVSDSDTALAAVTTAASSSDQDLVSNASITVSGSGTSRSITVTPISNLGGSVVVTLSANDGSHLVTRQFTVSFQSASNLPPVLSTIPNQLALPGAAVGPLSFSVSDGDTALSSVITTASSSDTNLVPNGNILVSGNGTTRTLTLTPANSTNSTTGTVAITLSANDGTTVTNSSFSVTFLPPHVNSPPTIGGIQNRAVSQGSTLGPIPFTVSDSDTSLTLVTTTATSSDTVLVPNGNIAVAGTGAERTITVTPAVNTPGNVIITLTADDGSTQTTRGFIVSYEGPNGTRDWKNYK